jgi:glycosyltransferase involved in cell wall biosynthesis
MMYFYELVQPGMSHAPFTRAFLHMAAHAFPGEPMTIFAQQTHLDSALGGADPLLDGRLDKQVYSPPTMARKDFWRRFVSTVRFLKKTYGPVAQQHPQVVFLSTEPHHIWAAKLFRLFNPGFRCHMVLHGDINSINRPRGRNPYHRAVDYFTSLSKANNQDVRFIALETHIKANLTGIIPAAGPVVDIIRHPCMPALIDWKQFAPVAGRMRFGLLGIAGRSKGLDVFAGLALRANRALAQTPEFRLIGKVQGGNENLDLSGVDGPLPLSPDWLPREVFDSEIAALHYVVLPYNMDYYGLSASGVLLDVLRWRKPIISFDTPVIRELIKQFGDIGHICADVDAMVETVDSLLADFDEARYMQQRQHLDAAYASRLPEAAAAEFTQLRRAGAMPQLEAI